MSADDDLTPREPSEYLECRIEISADAKGYLTLVRTPDGGAYISDAPIQFDSVAHLEQNQGDARG